MAAVHKNKTVIDVPRRSKVFVQICHVSTENALCSTFKSTKEILDGFVPKGSTSTVTKQIIKNVHIPVTLRPGCTKAS